MRPRIDGSWIRQLVGYALLDTDDEYAIRALGIYLARQGFLVEWSLDEALPTLAGGQVDLAAARADFARLLDELPD